MRKTIVTQSSMACCRLAFLPLLTCRQVASYRIGVLRMDDTEGQRFFKRVEVAIVVEQGVIVDDAKGGDETVYGLADSQPARTQMSIVTSSGNRQFDAARVEDFELAQVT